MRVVSLALLKWQPDHSLLLSLHADLSFANFFIRSMLKEHVIFHSRLVSNRTNRNERQSIELENSLGCCHIYVHPSGVSCAVITDPEYPQRVAFAMIDEMLKVFLKKYEGMISTILEDKQLPFPEGDEALKVYQNPKDADKLLKIEDGLDKVKEVMLKNVDELCKQGEKLESLMMKASDLKTSSVEFYRTAKAQNQCCQLY